MQDLALIILVIQSFNLLVTIIFLAFFFRRLWKIKPMAVTNKYLDKDWLVRFIITVLYIIISAVMLIIQLKYSSHSEWTMNLLSSGTFGFCINSIVLFLHVIVLNLQLKRELPSSHLHRRFLIYLLFISCVRLGVSVYQMTTTDYDQGYKIGILVLVCLQVIASMIMLVNWQYKKNKLPIFDDVANMDIQTITEKINKQHLLDNNSHNTQKISNDRWNFIVPTVSFQLGKIRIILETFTDDDILKSLCNQETKVTDFNNNKNYANTYTYKQKQKQKQRGLTSSNFKSLVTNRQNRQKLNQHLQIISDRHYSKKELQNIYLTCARFTLFSRINFDESSDANYYRQVKRYVQQIFGLNKIYTHEILQLFYIDRESINTICSTVNKMISSQDQLLVSTFVDSNALFLSVEIFKQLWTHDHFIFYIHAVTMDKKDRSVCYKRYSDFQDFHHKLQAIVNQENKQAFILPNLPKKHFFSWKHADQQKANQRRKQLQTYCRQTFNDFQIMSKMPSARQLILQFMQLKDTIQITPNIGRAIQFYDGLQIEKGNIYKALVGEQYVTFYEFQIFRNGISTRSIYKRFRQFIYLHENLNRWMNNTQILYKFVVLPEKHLYNSETKRHQKLKHYLDGILSIKENYKIHAVNQFLNMGKRHDSEANGFGMSIIKRTSQCQQSDIMKVESDEPSKQFDFSADSQRQRMSLLIEQLGQQ